MKKFLTLLLLSAVAMFAQTGETITFRAAMLPSNENPAIDINASGTALIRAHVARNAAGEVVSGTVDFTINYTFPGAMEFTGLHIHRGDVGINGPVLINTGIGGTGGNVVDTVGKGIIFRAAQVRPTDAAGLDALRDMLDNPAGYYVNIHSTVNPGGVIRGQLQKPEIVTYMAFMSPDNEVPAITGENASGFTVITAMRTFDGDGKINTGLVTFEAEYDLGKEINITGYHIHQGPAGMNASVVVNTGISNMPSGVGGKGTLLFPVELDMSRPASSDVLNALFTDPSGFYVNIHTTEYTGGLIRGQLRSTDSNTFTMNLSPANEVPAIDINASGPASFKVNTIRNEAGEVIAGKAIFDVNYRFPGETTFTGLHIHDQVAGQNGSVTINTGLSGTNTVVTTDGFGNIYKDVLVTSTAALATLNSLLQSPEKHYMNLHTTVNPGGVVRSQVKSQFASEPSVADVVSSASAEIRTVAPGEWIYLYGAQFAHANTDTRAWQGTQLPTTLNGVEVTIGGAQAPIYLVSEGRVEAQVPFSVEAGTQPIVVKNQAGTSAAFMVNLELVAPAIVLSDASTNTGTIIRLSDLAPIGPGNPGAPGDILIVGLTGMGQATPELTTGKVVASDEQFVIPGVTVTVGDTNATVLAALALPGLPGLYAVGFMVPAGLSGAVPLEVSQGTAKSNTVTLALQ